MLTVSGVPAPRSEAEAIEAVTAWARSALGDRAFETHSVRGSILPPEELARVVAAASSAGAGGTV